MHKLVSSLRAIRARSRARYQPRPWPEEKEEFCCELARRLEDLDRDTGLLHMAASRRVPREEVEFLVRLTDLRERTRRLQRALQVYGGEEGEAWRSFRSKAELRWTELRRELTEAFDWYRARYPRGEDRQARG